MEDNQEKRMILLMGFVLIILIIVIPIDIIFFDLPWYLSFNHDYGIILGIILLIFGIIINYFAIMNLGYKHSDNNMGNIHKLVTTGIYAYTQNSMYLGQGIIIFGLFIIFPLTIFIIPVLFVFSLYSRVKTEENELYIKFGRDFI